MEHRFGPILRPNLFAAFLVFFSVAVEGPQSVGLIQVHQLDDCICSSGLGEGLPIQFSVGQQPANNLASASCGAGHTYWPGCFSFCLPTVLWVQDFWLCLAASYCHGVHQREAHRPWSLLLRFFRLASGSRLGNHSQDRGTVHFSY